MRLIFIDGNIGSGKSTFINKLHEHYNTSEYAFILEPLDKWQKDDFISEYYKDRKRWGLTFQLLVLTTKYNLIIENIDKKIVFVERSFHGDKVFATLMHDSGQMTDIEYSIYNNIFNEFMKLVNQYENVTYNISRSPETCLRQIKERGRICEKKVELEFLEKLDTMYKHTCVTIDLNGKDIQSIDITSLII